MTPPVDATHVAAASAIIRPLAGHSVLLLLLQLAILLIAARLGAELAKRLGLPVVVGELSVGLLLGPTVLGHYLPHVSALLFPQKSEPFHLLEVVSTMGMVLLLLITGLETDLRLLRNLGRSAFIASVAGMVVPFGLGYALGMYMPDRYVAHPDQRVIFSLFLATAMSISAMPVIAKILMDLDLTNRNLGLVILSAGVVDDTTGWLVLSLIAGAVSQGGVQVGDLLRTVGLLGAFLLGSAVILYPLLRWLMRVFAQRFRAPDSDLVLIVVTTLLCAALTEWIGVHAVFGAFVAGTILRQVPTLRAETVHRLESFVFAILAPVFFGIVGLRVDLWTLHGGAMLGIAVGVACVGKLVGCTVGGLYSGMNFWEAFSLAVAMNARGAMELVVAMIGLSLGILNQEMFSIIVVIAVSTSFMAPLALRFTMRLVRMTQEEEQRILAEKSKGVFDPDRVSVLVPTAGGKNALGAAQVALSVAQRSQNPTHVVYIESHTSLWQRLRHPFRKNPAGRGIAGHLDSIKSMAQTPPVVRTLASNHVAATICEEAGKGFDVILLGASQHGASLGGAVVEKVVADAPCHVVIVKTQDPAPQFRRILVRVDGSVTSRVAAEFACRYAEVSGAELTLAVVTERPMRQHLGGEEDSFDGEQRSVEEELSLISPVFRASTIRPKLLHRMYDPLRSAVLELVKEDPYDLVVLGAENRAVQHRLFFGYDNERIIRRCPTSVMIVIPHIGRLTAEHVRQTVQERRPEAAPIPIPAAEPAAAPASTASIP